MSTPYASYHATMIALSNHCSMHPGCGTGCPEAIRLNNLLLNATGQATRAAAEDEGAQAMTAATKQRIRTEVDGHGVSCSTQGCGQRVGWFETPQEASDAQYNHQMMHARQGFQATVEIFPERGMKEQGYQ